MAHAQTPSEAYEKVTTPGTAAGGSKRRCSPNVLGKSLIGFGIFFVILGIVYGTVLPKVIDKKVQSGVVTCNLDDAKKEAYTDPYSDCDDCSPYYYKLRLFNVTNAEDHLNNNAKLKLQEVGPWTYRRRQIRGDISFENERVTYTQYTYHTYEPEMSCAGCKDTDIVIGYDVGYLNVIAQAGGEKAFLVRLAKGSFGSSKTDAELIEIVQNNGTQMMKWVNGLNSYDPDALKTVGPAVLTFLVVGPSALTELKLDGFAYNGLFVPRTISQWALGYSSMLAGIGLASNYNKICVTGGLNDKCKACIGKEATPECLAMLSECKKCKSGEKVRAINKVSCGKITDVYAAKFGAEAATAWTAGACGMCSDTVPLCAAPLPGIVEKSGLDYSTAAPPAGALTKYVARTGCDDKSMINEYEMFDGYKETALWAALDNKTRNPTLPEIMAFQTYANCISPLSNVSCSVVRGNDATSMKPGGVSMSGFESELDVATSNIYLLQANQNVTLFNQDKDVDFHDITLHRFAPAKDLLNPTAENAKFGTGTPYAGVQPLAFTTQFLAYVSYPLFLWGDKALLEGFELTMDDGVIASHATMYDGETLKSVYEDKYATYIDVEAGTGKTMRARKRLQASYALSVAVGSTDAMSDVLWPKLETDVIVPMYWGEEMAEAAPKRIDYYKGIKTLLGSLIPVLIVGIVLGVVMVAYGFFHMRKHAGSSSKSAAGTV